MVAATKIPLSGSERLVAALKGDDTIPPGTLVRLRHFPGMGPFTNGAVVTIESYGGDYEVKYKLLYTVKLEGGQFEERAFVASAANVFVAPGDNPEPAIVHDGAPDPHPAEQVNFGDGDTTFAELKPDPRACKAQPREPQLRWSNIPGTKGETACGGRFRMFEFCGQFTVEDKHRGHTTRLSNRYAAELWCKMQLANEETLTGREVNGV